MASLALVLAHHFCAAKVPLGSLTIGLNQVTKPSMPASQSMTLIALPRSIHDLLFLRTNGAVANARLSQWPRSDELAHMQGWFLGPFFQEGRLPHSGDNTYIYFLQTPPSMQSRAQAKVSYT